MLLEHHDEDKEVNKPGAGTMNNHENKKPNPRKNEKDQENKISIPLLLQHSIKYTRNTVMNSL